LVTKFKYYTALSKWNGQCAVGEYILKYCKINDNEIKKCKNNKRALTLFLNRHVIPDVQKEKRIKQI